MNRIRNAALSAGLLVALLVPVAPAVSKIDETTKEDKGLIRNMSPKDIRDNYILYIGAGAVAAGGIISMLKALPVIAGSVAAGFRDLKAERAAARGGTTTTVPRTERGSPFSQRRRSNFSHCISWQ